MAWREVKSTSFAHAGDLLGNGFRWREVNSRLLGGHLEKKTPTNFCTCFPPLAGEKLKASPGSTLSVALPTTYAGEKLKMHLDRRFFTGEKLNSDPSRTHRHLRFLKTAGEK